MTRVAVLDRSHHQTDGSDLSAPKMRPLLLSTVLVILLLLMSEESASLYLGFGGVVGKLTPRTGSKWPPYPGAGQG